ncbi:hypothetical protein J2J97_27980 (plasmid) [Rhizobium bangladeshense]|uniref:hypothetical protein n=1 Tax=Rhizobium bangladeshense TaxID=1138189 RepID=UPI001A98C1C5|nr:hypothetical protein [Rhizobium bangladeshense]QSY97959.1 hypothetical protein J2J97_27980 [Rhizobium bangladeshense]
MKTQQRRFVVEIKSKGRRSAVKQGSIWGTTDLKAVARQAASVAPHLFDDAGATLDIPADEPALVVAPVPLAPGAIDVATVQSAPVEIRSVDQLVIAPTPIEKRRSSTTENPSATAQPSRSVARVKRKSRSLQKPAAPAAQNPVTVDETSTDDLALLELENRRLKSLLIEHLQQQNRQLRKMLERFGGNLLPPE